VGGTNLGREASPELFQKMGFLDEAGNLRPEIAASLKTLQQGAATTVWCATSPALDNLGGVYCEDSDIAELDSPASPSHGVSPYSLDELSAKRLWELSENVTGVEFKAI
jgi:hypothetical protein